MKVCFVGVGSIAKRHIRNVCDILTENSTPITIDVLRRCSHGIKPEFVNHVYVDVDKMPCDYDVIFITNPTECHADSLLRLHDKGKHFFIEKPITSFDTINKLDGFRAREDSIYYVACPLRYSSIVQYLKQHVDIETVISARCISSSYLPEWRPETDYRNTYSAHKDLGGGVSMDLIHEWDYLTYLFGMPCEVKLLKGKVSDLEIDSDDYAIYIAKYKSMIAELHLDYFGRKPIRMLELFTKDDTIVSDFLSGEVVYLKANKRLFFTEERDNYQKQELKHFFDLINSKKVSDNGINHSIEVLKLSQGII